MPADTPAPPLLGRGARYILLATLFFMLMNVGVKWLTRIPSHEVVFFRAVVILLVTGVLVKRAGISPWGQNRPLLLARGAAGTVALVLYFYTVQVMPLGSAVTIQYLSPLVTVAAGALLLGERASGRQWLFLVLAFAGVPLVKGLDPRVSMPELIAGVTSALFSGLAYTVVRKLRDTDHPLVVVLWFPLVTVPVVGAYTAFHWVTPQGLEWLVLLGVGLCTTAFQILITRAYHADTAANVSVFNYLGTVFAVGLGYLVFDESLQPLAYLGFALIIAGAVLANRESRRRASQAVAPGANSSSGLTGS